MTHNLILDAVNMNENGKKRRIQVIIETHSEHLLRRLQRRIAEERISDADVNAYFAENNHKCSKLNRLEVDKYGNILNWPEGFFGDMEKDMYEQAMKAMDRKIDERAGKAYE